MTNHEFIPNSIPAITGNESAYVLECLRTGWVSSVGPFVDRFEAEFARYVGAAAAISTCNGTAALHLALVLLGVGPGDRVVVPSLTFIASVNPIAYCGAEPVFVDSEESTANADPAAFVEVVERLVKTGKPPKALMPVHLYGHPAQLAPVLACAHRHGIPVVEDASESLGGRLGPSHVGVLGTLGGFSFNGNKLLTSGGGGGMLVTNDPALARRAKHLSTQARADAVEYSHDAVGYNYRMTNIHAAFGCAQLEQLDEKLAMKRRIYEQYVVNLRDIAGIRLLREQTDWAVSSHWMVNILVDDRGDRGNSRTLLRHLLAEKIQARPFFVPAHTLPMYRHLDTHAPIAERLHRHGLNLPCSVQMTGAQVARVAASIRRHLAGESPSQ